jgi:L-malate glycosyltransferase
MTLRVLQLIHNLKREGAQTMVATLAQSFDAATVEVSVYPWRKGGTHVDNLRGSGLKVLETSGRNHGVMSRIRAGLELRRIANTKGTDLVHAHMSDSAILAGLALLGTDVPFIITHHSNRLAPNEGFLKGILRKVAFRWATRRATLNIGVTDAVAERLVGDLKLLPGKVRSIPNGVSVPSDVDFEAARLARDLRRYESSPLRIVALGRLVPLKSQTTMIQAMSQLRQVRPDAHLMIAGDGPSRQQLTEMISQMDLASQVSLLGPIDDVASFLKGADIFISTSSHEGLPIAVLEAMSWGLPVIITDVPGHRDVIKNGTEGYLVPFDDARALADHIVRLSNVPSEAIAVGAAARQRVIEMYSSAGMAHNYAQTYRSILNGGRTA